MLSARSETAVTVRAAGDAFVCELSPGLDLSASAAGVHSTLHCHRLDGAFRSGFARPENAVAEVPH